MLSVEVLPLPLCADDSMVNPHLFPVVAYILSVVCDTWECLRMKNPYHSVVEATETTGDSGFRFKVRSLK